MKARNLFLALVLLAAAGVFFGATQASAIKEVDPVAFGMFGITQGQTARLSVANLDSGEFVPCVRLELSFIDGDGKTLLQKVYDVEHGKSAFLDLSGNQFVGRGGRSQIRALVRFVGTPDTRDDPFFLPSLEVIDNATGRTSFLIPAVQKVQKVSPATN